MERLSDSPTIARPIHQVPPELGAFLAGDARVE